MMKKSLKSEGCHNVNFVIIVPQVDIMTTWCAISDDKVGIMTILRLQWFDRGLIAVFQNIFLNIRSIILPLFG